jgi:hypothetical protein
VAGPGARTRREAAEAQPAIRSSSAAQRGWLWRPVKAASASRRSRWSKPRLTARSKRPMARAHLQVAGLEHRELEGEVGPPLALHHLGLGALGVQGIQGLLGQASAEGPLVAEEPLRRRHHPGVGGGEPGGVLLHHRGVFQLHRRRDAQGREGLAVLLRQVVRQAAHPAQDLAVGAPLPRAVGVHVPHVARLAPAQQERHPEEPHRGLQEPRVHRQDQEERGQPQHPAEAPGQGGRAQGVGEPAPEDQPAVHGGKGEELEHRPDHPEVAEDRPEICKPAFMSGLEERGPDEPGQDPEHRPGQEDHGLSPPTRDVPQRPPAPRELQDHPEAPGHQRRPHRVPQLVEGHRQPEGQGHRQPRPGVLAPQTGDETDPHRHEEEVPAHAEGSEVEIGDVHGRPAGGGDCSVKDRHEGRRQAPRPQSSHDPSGT